MERETDNVWDLSQKLAVSLRVAAYVHALHRIGEAIDDRGSEDDYR
jgi:glutamate dehydrogenase (NADP+)